MISLKKRFWVPKCLNYKDFLDISVLSFLVFSLLLTNFSNFSSLYGKKRGKAKEALLCVNGYTTWHVGMGPVQ